MCCVDDCSGKRTTGFVNLPRAVGCTGRSMRANHRAGRGGGARRAPAGQRVVSGTPSYIRGMKYLLCLALLGSAPAMAQMQPPAPTVAERLARGLEVPEPFKGANSILVHCPDSAGVALKQFARALIQAGLEPDRIDPEGGYLTTRGKSAAQLPAVVFSYQAIGSREPGGTLLTITGSYTVRMSLANSVTIPMNWTQGNGNPGKACFALIEPVALAYPRARIGYKLQPERPVMNPR